MILSNCFLYRDDNEYMYTHFPDYLSVDEYDNSKADTQENQVRKDDPHDVQIIVVCC